MPEVHDKFLIIDDYKANALTHYHAPFTGGFRCIIPKGTILRSMSDSNRLSLGFGAVPTNYKEFESEFVPTEQRENPKYSGYSFVFKYTDIGKILTREN